MRWVVAATVILSASPAHATLGVASNAGVLASAATVAIINVTSIANGDVEGTVIEAFRGPPRGAHLKVNAALPAGTGDALVVCSDDTWCGADRDRGGFFVIALPGRKAPTVLEPGLIERRALPALTTGKRAPDLCVHAKLHFLDEPPADAALEGTFAAGDGTGTMTGALLGGQPLDATLLVGGPTMSDASEVQIRLKRAGLALAGAPVTRGADGCLAVPVLIDEPLVRTRRGLTARLAGRPGSAIVARGTIQVTSPLAGIAKGSTALSLSAGHTIEASGPLFAANVLCDLDTKAGLRVGCQAKLGGEAVIWLDFGAAPPPLPGASSNATLAALVADAKPHAVTVTFEAKGKPIVPLGTATITHVAE